LQEDPEVDEEEVRRMKEVIEKEIKEGIRPSTTDSSIVQVGPCAAPCLCFIGLYLASLLSF